MIQIFFAKLVGQDTAEWPYGLWINCKSNPEVTGA